MSTLRFLILILFLAATGSALQIGASPKLLSKSGDSTILSWSGLNSPSDLDWIGIYSPADSLDENFIGYVLLSTYTGWSSGNGSLEIPLVNIRSPYQFRLFQGVPANATKNKRFDEDGNVLPSTEVLLGVTGNVEFKSFNEPTQVHLSLTSQPGEVKVMFVTRDLLDSVILFGSDEKNLETAVEANATTYEKEDMCDGPANSTLGWRHPGFIYSGVIRGLEPSKRYFYKVGSRDGQWSDTFSFVSPPKEGEETTALLFGDLGTDVPYKTFLWTQAQSVKTLNWLEREIEKLGDKPTFISHIGDISYARGYAWLWDEFFHRIQPVAARAPYLVCIGNHEYDWPLQPWKPQWASYGKDGGGECGVPYSLRFQMPGNSSLPTGTKAPATRNLYFSITYGVVHFLYFSTETDFLPGSEQFKFMVKDLEAVDRSKVPFVVVLGHRPMYTSNHEVRDAGMRVRMLQYLEPVLVKFKVDLVLWGHVHKYERTCGLKNFTCGEALPVHVVIGMGGQDWQPAWEPRPEHPDYPIFPQPEWSIYRSEEFGYVRLHATRELLRLEYVGNGDGGVHDTLEIPARYQARNRGLQFSREGVEVSGMLWFLLGAAISGGALVAYKVWHKHKEQSGMWQRVVNVKV